MIGAEQQVEVRGEVGEVMTRRDTGMMPVGPLASAAGPLERAAGAPERPGQAQRERLEAWFDTHLELSLSRVLATRP